MWASCWALSAVGATLQVGPTRAYATPGDALAAAATGDRIEVDPGVWTGALSIDRPVALVGVAGASATVLEGPLQVHARLVLEGFTVAPDHTEGLNAASAGQLVVDRCVFRGADSPVEGGAMRLFDTDATVTRTAFVGNRARAGGAIHAVLSDLVLDGDLFARNVARENGGGAVYADHAGGRVTVRNSRFVGNRAEKLAYPYGYDPGYGGALLTDQLDLLDITGSTFVGNRAWTDGGAVSTWGFGSRLHVSESRFCENGAAGTGGAVSVESSGEVVVAGSLFASNDTALGAAFASWWNPVTLVDDTFLAGQAHVDLYEVTATLVNDLFVDAAQEAVHLVGGSTVEDYDLFWGNASDLTGAAPGSHDVFADPLLTGWSDDGDCTNDAPVASGAGVDAGWPALTDLDGSVSDIGAGP